MGENRQIFAEDLEVGKRYVVIEINTGESYSFIFGGIDTITGDVLSANSPAISSDPRLVQFFDCTDPVPVKWVDIPADVPVRFKSKVFDGDWYIGWFDPVSGLFRGLSRGDSKVSEHYEEDIEWETL